MIERAGHYPPDSCAAPIIAQLSAISAPTFRGPPTRALHRATLL